MKYLFFLLAIRSFLAISAICMMLSMPIFLLSVKSSLINISPLLSKKKACTEATKRVGPRQAIFTSFTVNSNNKQANRYLNNSPLSV